MRSISVLFSDIFVLFVFFFFKQKTAYEMRISDWSSDVCSSDLVYLFQAAGVILLIAMIGAIVLTLRSREGVRRQSIEAQNARRPADVVEVMKVTRGGGV